LHASKLTLRRPDSPVGEILDRDNANVLASIQRENAKKLTALFTELTGNIAILQSPDARADIGDQVYTSCLELLLQTLYVDLGPELLRCAYECMYSLRRIVAKDGNVPDERIEKAKQDLHTLLQAVGLARDKLIKGQFSEPPTISMLVWRMGPARFAEERMAFCNYAEESRTSLDVGAVLQWANSNQWIDPKSDKPDRS